ncbi:MAG: hypothetical protein Q9214_002362 [Letrouitia sp. 1 TL-2023]
MLEALKLPSRVLVFKHTTGSYCLADTRVSRLISTSSAINRGIRRSQRADRGKPPVSRKEANHRYGDRQGRTRSLGQRRGNGSRPSTQKFEGSELSRKVKGDSPFSRQRNPPDHVMSKSNRHTGEKENSRHNYKTSNELGLREDRKQRVTRTKRPTPGKTESSPGQNRVDRQASAQVQLNPSTAGRSLFNVPSNRSHKPSEPTEQQPVILTKSSRLRSGEPRVNEAERYSPPKPKSQVIEGSTLLEEGERPRRGPPAPISIPYTTPASEFLYGLSVVTAALKASRRKLYKLYLYNEQNAEVRGQDQQVRKLGLAAGIVVTRVGHEWLRLMDKMSKGRPHNGYVLEASPLPKLPITGLLRMHTPAATFRLSLDYQSSEEQSVNGTQSVVPYTAAFPRFPFVLFLDGILDPGNLGAIIRTAYFLGVDSIVLSRNSAPLSPVALKAAAGAAEAMPLLWVNQPAAFIDSCQQNGWKFYASVAPGSSEFLKTGSRKHYFSTRQLMCPSLEHPTVLILGSEGDGIRWTVQKKADYVIGVEGQSRGHEGVDSLNVSVAAGLLCEAFLDLSGVVARNPKWSRQVTAETVETAGAQEVLGIGSDGKKVSKDSDLLF